MKTKKVAFFLLFCFFFFPVISLAAPFDYTPLEKIPGFETQTDGNFYTYISLVYKFGIWAVGIAALLMISIGGFMYVTSAGNNSSMEKAKGVITDALVGLILALTSYLLLYIINPDLVKIKTLSTVGVSGAPTAGGVAPGVPVTGVAAGCKPGIACQACQNCKPITNCKESPCSLSAPLADKLNTALTGQNARVTEGWPPTVNHESSCHQNGTCADVNLTANQGDPQAVKQLYDSLKSSGLSPVYESSNCAAYIAVGVYCKNYAKTAPAFHVNL